MNRLFDRLSFRLLTLAAALVMFTACDDGGDSTPPPAADAGSPADPDDPPVAGAFLGLDADARACEVMLFDPAGQLGAPLFGPSVEGRSLRRGDRLALAFAHRADAPIAAGSVGLVARANGDGVVLETATCFDAEGHPLPNAEVSLDSI